MPISAAAAIALNPGYAVWISALSVIAIVLASAVIPWRYLPLSTLTVWFIPSDSPFASSAFVNLTALTILTILVVLSEKTLTLAGEKQDALTMPRLQEVPSVSPQFYSSHAKEQPDPRSAHSIRRPGESIVDKSLIDNDDSGCDGAMPITKNLIDAFQSDADLLKEYLSRLTLHLQDVVGLIQEMKRTAYLADARVPHHKAS